MSQSFTSTNHITQEELITNQQAELEKHSYIPSLTNESLPNNGRKANISFKESITNVNSNAHHFVVLDKCETGDLSTSQPPKHSIQMGLLSDKTERPLNSILKKEKRTTCNVEERRVGSVDTVNCADLSKLQTSYEDITRTTQKCAVKR